jgi:hypothetical protein
MTVASVRSKEERKPQPNRVVKPQLHETPAVESLVLQLRHLRDVLTQPEFHTAMLLHGRGKLTVQEKLTLLLDAGTFVEDLAPNPDLGPRHGARRLVTGHGYIQGRLVAAALFDASADDLAQYGDPRTSRRGQSCPFGQVAKSAGEARRVARGLLLDSDVSAPTDRTGGAHPRESTKVL